MHLDEDDMLREEMAYLWGASKPNLTGIALSGGGIRSGIVALGVLQVFASSGLLKRFDYVSTVSGGGYIGSALSWFWSNKRASEERQLSQTPVPDFGADSHNFPYQDADDGSQPSSAAAKNLEFLRRHGSYLTSGDGIGFAGLIVAVIRTIILSLIVWLPVLVFMFGMIEFFDHEITPQPVAESLSSCNILWIINFDDCSSPTALKVLSLQPFYAALIALAVLLIILFLLGLILLAFLSRVQTDSTIRARSWLRTVSRIVIRCTLAAAVLVYVVVKWRSIDQIQPMMAAFLLLIAFTCGGVFAWAIGEMLGPANSAYHLRRAFEKWSSFFLPFVVTMMFLGSLPILTAGLSGPGLSLYNSLGGLISLLSGVVTALYGYYLKAKSLLPGLAGQVLAPLGSVVFIAGLLLVSQFAAHELVSPDNPPGTSFPAIIAICLFFIAFGLGWRSSVNGIGLHRFYRDRLMETFMPMLSAIETGTARKSDVADILSIKDIDQPATQASNGRTERTRPYHLVNAHAIMINDPDAKVALRGGDNFLMSAHLIGSTTTGWIRTTDYLDRYGPLTLATAMAASGAAANANAGYIGTGVTRERFVSAAMALLNIRLGVWVGNPGAITQWNRRFAKWIWTAMPTYFRPVLTCGIFGVGNHSRAPFLELSDGGHFENLGLYELVRRKLKLIVVVDAEEDSSIHLPALVSSINRIREDFGAFVSFVDMKGPELLIGRNSDSYPSGALLARSPYIVGEITYKDNTKGALIYMKATMTTGLDFTTEGYKASNPDFPHQSTTDQFFDPDQFEAYRDLGKKSCARMIKQLDLENYFLEPSILVKAFRSLTL
ncbi:hypothetical protein EB235_16720 [Mesorhizobium loti R88b]|uniref:PNPLA domain-containing protein n=1 Tax=Mesorhizobium loti R88b TaxID=935548 RepID=A0A6M7WNC1_RHILI|nr:hypothetical protein EB235_16720 [Mesorhizobium loti R88b]